MEDEVIVTKTGNNPSFSAVFDQVLWKVTANPPNATIVAPPPINNQSPLFDSINVSDRYYDFHLQALSPALNKGITTTGVLIDLDGNSRPRPVATKPDLGCFERD